MEWGRFWFWATLAFCIDGCFCCLEEERIALLRLKESINYPNGSSFPSWISTNEESDCCHWDSVYCHNTTGRVIRLSLGSVRDYDRNQEHWYLNASLFLAFQELNSLDLRNNGIYGWVPNEGFERFSGLSKLEVLLLDDNFVNDSFLSSIGAIASLRYLSLESNRFDGPIHIPELGKLNNLQELYLDFTHTDTSILQKAGIMTSLNVLSMPHCELNGSFAAQGCCELRNLQVLDLRVNNLEGILPSCLANLTALRVLDLSSNRFNGSITPSHLSNLQSLEYLDLSNNNFNPITFSSFLNLTSLKFILSDNNQIADETDSQTWAPRFQLEFLSLSNRLSKRPSGMMPKFLHYQHELRAIDLSHNNFSESFPIWLLENNTRVELLSFRNNSFIGPFQGPYHSNPLLRTIDISNNNIRGPIPTNLSQVFPNLEYLNISGNAFEGTIPSLFSELVSLEVLDLSENHLSGPLPENLAMGCFSLWYIKLSNNNFSGQIFPTKFNLTRLMFLYLNNNHFSGKISNSLSSFQGVAFDFSNNNLSGMLPRWIGNFSSTLQGMAVANNQLEGPIPHELCKLKSLQFLDLSNNSLSGSIPSCSNLSFINHVHLNKNKLSGPIKSAFQNCSTLVTLNLRDNYLTGNIPDWLGSLSSLSILLLKSNHMQGLIPVQLCLLSKLSILDLSQNKFFGPIPPCLNNITFEVNEQKSDPAIQIQLPISFGSFFLLAPSSLSSSTPFEYNLLWHFAENSGFLRADAQQVDAQQLVEFTTKRRSDIYKGYILNSISVIDLSSNELIGEIPHELGNLSNIHALNLSNNNLTGSIPITFSKLHQIESLDLSNNDLDGVIPPQLVELNFLAVFSVAHNNLSGRIPERKAQFGTFEKSSYEGNPFLCGPPLNACNDVSEPPYVVMLDDNEGEESDSFMDMNVFYISFVVSYAMVVLAIAAILWINPYWRRAWFYLIEVWMINCYCFMVLNFRKLSNFGSTA